MARLFSKSQTRLRSRNEEIVAFYLQNKTMQQVGEKFGLSRERVRQILCESNVKIRYYTSRPYEPKPPRRFYGYVPSFEERFWMKVEKTDSCWIWTGKTTKEGYGYICFKSRTIYTHRLAYELVNGKAPNQWCLHKCDNPPCVNPAHLYDGSPQDNVRDRMLRVRGIKRV